MGSPGRVQKEVYPYEQSNVLYGKRDGLAYVTLKRPDAMNAIDKATNGELEEVWRDFATEDAVDVVILTDSGRDFCAGVDLKTFIPKWDKANMMDVRKNIPHLLGGGLVPLRFKSVIPSLGGVEFISIGYSTA